MVLLIVRLCRLRYNPSHASTITRCIFNIVVTSNLLKSAHREDRTSEASEQPFRTDQFTTPPWTRRSPFGPRDLFRL